jgi:hypothetical protein
MPSVPKRPRRSEAATEKLVCQHAVKLGVLALKFTPTGQRGWPDRLFLYKGRALFMEFKSEHGRLRPLQQLRSRALSEQRFPVFTVNTPILGKQILDRFLVGP